MAGRAHPLCIHSFIHPLTFVYVFPEVYFLTAFPPLSYRLFSPFVLDALPIETCMMVIIIILGEEYNL
jgi:hypothetical protein